MKYLAGFILAMALPFSAFAGTYETMATELLKKIPEKQKKRAIAVMPFSGNDEQVARIATEEMTKALINAGAVVSERTQIDKIIKEQELQQTGILSDENAADVGAGVGARYVVVGTISQINRYGEEGNAGLKINVKLVESASFKIIAAASGEVSGEDVTSNYRRKTVRKMVEYPQFLEVYTGITKFNWNGKAEEDFDTTKKFSEKMYPGLGYGLRFIHSSKGFYTSAWEFHGTTQKQKDNDLRYTTYELNWIPLLRVPLWRYFPALPDFTSFHFGLSIGLGFSNVKYDDSTGKSQKETGYGFITSLLTGFRLGISDSISVFAEYRYSPSVMNQYLRGEDSDGTSYSEEMQGHAIYFGLSIAP